MKRLKALIIILSVSNLFLITTIILMINQSRQQQILLPKPKVKPPHYKEVMTYIKTLKYSKLEQFMKPSVSISIHFKSHAWSVENEIMVDENNNHLLYHNTTGLCSELAEAAYQRLKPVFQQDYEIQLTRVFHAGYFKEPDGNHIVIKVRDQKALPFPKTYIIDPSFHIYDNIENLHEYSIHKFDTVVDPAAYSRSFMRPAGGNMPLFIKNSVMTSVAVSTINGRFDPGNFRLVLFANGKYMYRIRELISFNAFDGQRIIRDDPKLAVKLLGKKQWSLIRKRMFTVAQNIRMLED